MIGLMSTEELVAYLSDLNATSGGALETLRVDFQPELFLKMIAAAPLRVISSSDGLISTVEEHGDPVDFSRQTGSFDLHTDGLYLDTPPDYVLLYCVDSGSANTPTLIADSRAVIEQLRKSNALEILNRLDIINYNKVGRPFSRPLVQRHPRSHELVLNLGTRAFLQPRLHPDEIASSPSLRQITNAAGRLYQALDRAIIKQHRWSVGDLLVFDNYSYLHGRVAEQIDRQRKLLRVWLSWR